jgi:hypothetical protein
MRILKILVALLVWAILSWAFVFAFSNSHVCSILQTVATGSGPTPSPIPLDVLVARCNRPDIGAITASIVGLVAIIAVSVVTRPSHRRPSR